VFKMDTYCSVHHTDHKRTKDNNVAQLISKYMQILATEPT